MRPARPVGRAFSPLDEELGLLPGRFTPSLQESAVRLGTWLPFAVGLDEEPAEVGDQTVDRVGLFPPPRGHSTTISR